MKCSKPKAPRRLIPHYIHAIPILSLIKGLVGNNGGQSHLLLGALLAITTILSKLGIERVMLVSSASHVRRHVLEVMLRSHLLVDVGKRCLVRVLHLRVLLSLAVHHSSLRVEGLLEHLGTLGAILGAGHLHGNLVAVLAGDNQALLHVRAGRAAVDVSRILLAKRRELDGGCAVRGALSV
jgi:hypothetical protein